MRKLTLSPGILLLVAAVLFTACKKESSQNSANQAIIEKVNSWLDGKKSATNQEMNAKIQNLKENIDFNALRLEKYNQDEKLVVIPLNPGYKSIVNKGEDPINNLVLVLTGDGVIKKGNVFQYVPENNQPDNSVTANTFSKIFNHEKLTCNGEFTCTSITDLYFYNLGFKKGDLNAISEMRPKTDPAGSATGARINMCVDWYLITTYYYSDGSTEETSEYLGTSCSGCNPNDPQNPLICPLDASGGGGGGDGIEYEYAVSKPVDWLVSQYQTYWIVKSQEQLDGKRVTGEPQGGHFTGISHLTSYLASGNNSNWEQYSAVVSLDDTRLAHAYVTGKVTYTPLGYWEIVSNDKTWRFDQVF